MMTFFSDITTFVKKSAYKTNPILIDKIGENSLFNRLFITLACWLIMTRRLNACVWSEFKSCHVVEDFTCNSDICVIDLQYGCIVIFAYLFRTNLQLSTVSIDALHVYSVCINCNFTDVVNIQLYEISCK